MGGVGGYEMEYFDSIEHLAQNVICLFRNNADFRSSPYKLQPARYSRRMNLLASSRFVNLRLAESQNSRYNVSSSRSCTRRAAFPRSTDSASGPAQSKFDPAVLPPLQASSHSL